MRHRTYRFDPYRQFIKTPTDISDPKMLEFYLKNVFTAVAGITYVTIEIEKGTRFTEPSCKVLDELMKIYPTISYVLVDTKK